MESRRPWPGLCFAPWRWPLPDQTPGTTNFVVSKRHHSYEYRSFNMAATKKTIPSDVWSRRLKQARLAAGLSQRELGIAAGIDPSVASTRVNRYELGVHKADYQIAVQLAQVLAIPVAYLYCDDEALASMLLDFQRASPSVRRRVQETLRSSASSEA